MNIHDASVNLVAAMVKRAVLDAHPQSPIPYDFAQSTKIRGSLWAKERLEAHAWVVDLFREKPSNLAWAQAMWRTSYRKAAFSVRDKRLLMGNPDAAKTGRERRAAHVALLEPGYIPVKEAAEIVGLTPWGLTDRIRRGSRWAPEHKWFPYKNHRVLGISRESVMRLAADPKAHAESVQTVVRMENFKKRWDERRHRDRAIAERTEDRSVGAGRESVVLGGPRRGGSIRGGVDLDGRASTDEVA